MGNADNGSFISFGPFRLNAAERLLKKGDETLSIGGRALDVLIALVEHPGETVSPQELMARVWPDVTVEVANLRVHISYLRKALDDGREGIRYVMNVPGRGYRFVAPVTRPAAAQSSPVAESAIAQRAQKLPTKSTRMIGRDDVVRIVAAQLMLWRFVSIVGPGGIGKTTVAISVAHALLDGFGGAVFFIDLAALTDADLVPTAVASALGFMVQTQDPVLSILAFIGDKKVLLVLDNCEHVIDVAAPLAERVVSKAPQAHVLTTSREALRAEGEHVHLLYALDCPPEGAELTAAEALGYPAVRLFVERAAASGHGSALSDGEALIVARICRKLDGIALAIELVASRVGTYGLKGTEELLDNRFLLLWHGRRTALPRHQTLNAMLDWSYNLLSHYEKLVLCQLSAFVGDFTLEAACYVASEAKTDDAEVANAVTSLVAKSLVSTSILNGSTYYRLLDTTRAFAAGKLAEQGETDRIALRHATVFSEFLRQDAIVQSRFGEHDLADYASHIGNVRAALEWAFSDHGDSIVGAELAGWAASLFVGLSLLEECKRWCERALAALDATRHGTRQEMILQEALALSSMFTSGNSDRVRAAIDRGLALAESLQDWPHQLQLLAGLNIFLMRIGDFRGASAVGEKAGAAARAADDPAGLVMAEWMLVGANVWIGNQIAAHVHFERGMAQAIRFGTPSPKFFGYNHRLRALDALCRALWLRGLSDQALGIARQAIEEAMDQDRPVTVCMSLIYCSAVFLWTGDFRTTEGLIDQAIAYAERYSLAPYRAFGIGLKGELAVARDEPEAALPLLRSTLESLRAEQHNILFTVFAGALAEGLRKVGRSEEALSTIDVAIAHGTSSGTGWHTAELLRIKALILAAMPQQEQSALECLASALAVAREQSALAFELRSAIDLARLLAKTGQRDDARQVLTPVYDRFTEGFDTADLRAARRLICDLADRPEHLRGPG